MNDHLTFADPGWLLVILLIVPLVIIKSISALRARAGLEKLTSTRLRGHLVSARRPLGDWGRFALQAIGLILLAVALARPQKGYIEEMTRVEGRNIIIAIDTSRSMLAEDISGSTSRLQQAKFAAIDLIKALPDDRIGLMAFAGTAMMQSPLTPDHNAVIETVDQLNTFVIERGGTNLSAAIEVASKRLASTSAARNALILFTDGDDLEGVALKAAEKAAKENVVIITVGLGSEVPVIVPDPESGKLTKFLKDDDGQLVKSSMDRESLEKIANATNGSFIGLNRGLMDKNDVEKVLANISYSESEDKLKRTPRERFFVPLLLGLACITGAFIATLWGSRPAVRPAIATLLLLGAFSAQNLFASTESDAYTSYKNGNYEQARDQYLAAADQQKKHHELAFGSGSAAYQHGDYDTALQAFGEALTSNDPKLQARSHYNLGNTLFRKGEEMWKDEEGGGIKKIAEVIREWEDAAIHYRDTLEINSENQDAQTNLDIVEDLLEQLKKIQDQQEQKPEEEEQEEDQKEDEEKKEEEKSEEEPSDPDDEGEEKPDPGEEGEETDPEGDPGEEEGEDPEPGEGEGEQPDDSEEGGEDPNGEEPKEWQTEGEGEGEGDEEGKAPGEEAKPVDPDDEVDEKTGYSKNQARENLEKLSDEQRSLGLLRRRQLRQSTRRYRDW